MRAPQLARISHTPARTCPQHTLAQHTYAHTRATHTHTRHAWPGTFTSLIPVLRRMVPRYPRTASQNNRARGTHYITGATLRRKVLTPHSLSSHTAILLPRQLTLCSLVRQSRHHGLARKPRRFRGVSPTAQQNGAAPSDLTGAGHASILDVEVTAECCGIAPELSQEMQVVQLDVLSQLVLHLRREDLDQLCRARQRGGMEKAMHLMRQHAPNVSQLIGGPVLLRWCAWLSRDAERAAQIRSVRE